MVNFWTLFYLSHLSCLFLTPRHSCTITSDYSHFLHHIIVQNFYIMPKVGRRRKKTRTHAVEDETVASALTSSQDLKVPKSLVVGQFSEVFEHFGIHFMAF